MAAAAFVFAMSVWATALLPPRALVGPPHQTLGAIGWFGVLLFADSGIVALLGFLGTHVALTLVQLGLAGRLDRPTLVDLAVVIAITAGFQVAVGAAGAALDRVAAAATEAARLQAATVTAEEVARSCTTTGRNGTAGCATASCRCCAGWATACRRPTAGAAARGARGGAAAAAVRRGG